MSKYQQEEIPYVVHRHVPPGMRWQGIVPYHLVSLTLAGGCTYRLGSERVAVTPGDLLCLSPGMAEDWQADSEEGWKVSWAVLQLSTEVRGNLPPANLASHMACVHLEGEVLAEAKAAFARMLAWNGRFSPVRDRIIANQLNYILLLCRDLRPDAKMDPRLQAAQTFLLSRLEVFTSLDQVCLAAHLSRARLCTLFKAQFGTTPLDYLESLRLEEATRRLRFTADTIDTIAADLTYRDRKYFDRRFKRRYDITPYAYRRTHLKS